MYAWINVQGPLENAIFYRGVKGRLVVPFHSIAQYEMLFFVIYTKGEKKKKGILGQY
jgi:hypothetical protein